MPTEDSADLLILLEDYDRSLRRRLAETPSSGLGPSERPIWLELRDFDARRQWQRTKLVKGIALPPSSGPDPEFLLERYDPIHQFAQASGATRWPADEGTSLDLEVPWPEHRSHSRPGAFKALSAVLHAMGLLILLIPGINELNLTEPADWDSMQFTLVAPSLENLPPLIGQTDVPGEGEGGFRGLPVPPVAPEPEPDPEPEAESQAEPEPEEEAVPQPIESEEAAEADEPPAIEDSEEPEESGLPAAQSPAPAEFRRGPELAQSRDPRVLPMPAAPSRKRAVLQLENPKASMPGRQGSAQLGSLELAARPDQVTQGAIQQMIRGGGMRQAVGDGVGGAPSAGILPSGPTNSGSAVELLSDPRGVDFRPYLTQVLAAVRRNWFAVIPESARLGMSRGRTLIQFSVARNGSVPKLVIARSSGTPPLDRAAVAGISASNPFPPLPGEYLGPDIRLQFTFLYNVRNP